MSKYFDFRDYSIHDFGDLAYMLNDIGDKFEEAEKEQEEMIQEIDNLQSEVEMLGSENFELREKLEELGFL